MYHRFHAPTDIVVEGVTYLSGDCWNVNPIALKRVERLFCRNERAVIEARTLISGQPLLIVPVAAILVASIRLHCLDTVATLRDHGPGRTACSARIGKGEEMGWFEHGSTIILFLPKEMRLADSLVEGRRSAPGRSSGGCDERAASPPLGKDQNSDQSPSSTTTAAAALDARRRAGRRR